MDIAPSTSSATISSRNFDDRSTADENVDEIPEYDLDELSLDDAGFEEEEIFPSTASSSNDGVGADKKIFDLQRWPVIEYEDENISIETRELLRLCNNYLELYYKRYKEGVVSKSMLRQVRFLFEMYGLRQFDRTLRWRKNPKSRHIYMGKVRYPKFCNLYLFLIEMNKLEDIVGQHMWDLYYISSPDLFNQNREVADKYFNIRVLSVLRQVFKFVIKRDWSNVAAELGNLRLVYTPQHHEKSYLRTMLDSFSFYLPSLYLAALQRHLEYDARPLILSHKCIQTAAAFIKTSQFRRGESVYLNYSGFYAAHLLILHVANNIFDSSDYITELNKKGVKNTDAAWTDAFNLYSYCYKFEHFVSLNEGEASSYVSTITRDLDHRFSMTLNILIARSALGLLPAFVFVAITFYKIDLLTEALEQICDQNPGSIVYINEVLAVFGLERICGALFDRIMFSPFTTPEMLAQHDFVINIVEQRSLNPSGYGAFVDVVATNLKILFSFLDNGRNRMNGSAWALLYSNIQYLQPNFAEVLLPYWKDRHSWWPKFHLSAQLSANDAVNEKKMEVFKLLNSMHNLVV
ncbi:TAF RNA polymerase I subunit A domain-containing protein [Ditylenchus destructor]|uniref:TAF RNA polymerase I subunit A domain-containing protein n=1 Tax=Ditylenchus destructor TaxID=166010 RepID=A0AAD4NBZ6_9BILA|nr:TAF RNA polymerase I subunit A domain-containing protein [Ditylenchus destructor]